MRISRVVLASAAAAALVGGALAATPSAAVVEVPEKCIESVPDPGTTAPVSICYTLFKPAAASADNRVPLILHSHGWGGSRATAESGEVKAFVDQGFGVLSFDQRGFGDSGGKAHVENPDVEGQDVQRLVDEVAALPWVAKQRRNDPVIGAIGGSYGGGYQFVGAFSELRDKGFTRFDALAPEITWWDLKESLAPAEVARTEWLAALYAMGNVSAAHTDTVHKGFAYGSATGQWPNGPVAEAGGFDLDAFFEKNGPAWHVSQGRKLDIPVAFGQGVTDTLFNLNQGLKNYANALTPKARKKSIFIGYNGGHVLPTVFPPGVGSGGDPCSAAYGQDVNNDGEIDFLDVSLRFMLENLKGIATGLTGHGVYQLSTASGTCVTTGSVTPDTAIELGTVATTTAAGAPVAYKLTDGPITVAGAPRLDALVTALGADTRAFFGLAIGTSPADAKLVQNQTMPWRELLPTPGTQRTIELPAVAVEVPAGQSLFLLVSPIADMYAGHGSRTPGAMVLQNARLTLPVVQ